MSEISKPDYTYIWSSGGALVSPSNTKIQTGWTAEVPPFQWENWSQNRQDQAISHILQKGISVWSNTGEYYFTSLGERSYVQGSDGNIYVAVADSVGQNPTTDVTDTYWKLAFVSPNQFESNLSANGYAKRPDGLIMQWGNATFPNSGTRTSTAIVTLPLAWPSGAGGLRTAVANVNGQANTSVGGIPVVGVPSNTATTITFIADTLGYTTFNTTDTFFWYALGV